MEKETEEYFIEYKADSSYLIFNPDISKKIFYKGDEQFLPQTDPFKKNKPSNVFRIFVLGASTAYGFPYTHNTSFPRILKRSLQKLTTRKIEVINLSLTAINTYTLRELNKAIIPHEPDLVIIYAGHNEYYGIHGIASTYSIGQNLLLKEIHFVAKQSYLYNWIESHIQAIPDETQTQDKNLMHKLSKDKYIAKNDPLFRKGIEQFKHNIGKIIQSLSNENIPILIGTLTSNITDIEPLDYSSTLEDNLESHLTYHEAISEVTKGDTLKALNKYQNARDQDKLRFRAPSEFNVFLQALVKENNINISPIDSFFQVYNLNSKLSNELFLEHVHPTIKGYYLMAYCFQESIIKIPEYQNIFINPQKDFKSYYDENSQFTTSLDSVYGELLIQRLKKEWPFFHKAQIPVRIDTLEYQLALNMINRQIPWAQTMDIYFKECLKTMKYHKARKAALALMEEIPLSENPIIYYLESLKYLNANEETLKYSLEYVKRNNPNYEFISRHVTRVFKEHDDLSYLKNHLSENATILGEFGLYLETILVKREYEPLPTNK